MPELLNTPLLKLIPGWTYRALIRNRATVDQFTTYSKVAPFLAYDDLVEWARLNLYIEDIFTKGIAHPVAVDPEILFDTITPGGRTDWAVNVAPSLRPSQEPFKDLAARLSGVNPAGEFEYKFISTPNTLWLVLNEGFVTKIVDSSYRMTFFKAALRELYALLPMTAVSETWLYKLYLKQLSIESLGK